MPREQRPGIYLEIKGLSGSTPGPDGMTDYKHAYLVYRKQDGKTQVLRGGPSWHLKLQTETGMPLGGSADKNPNAERRPSKRLPIEGKDIDAVWKIMRSKVDEIGRARLWYDPFFPGDDTPEKTSNSVVRAALEAGGIDLQDALPEGVKAENLPGYEDNLQQDLIQIRPLREITDSGLPPTRKRKELRELENRDLTVPARPNGSDFGAGNDTPTGSGLGVEAARNAEAEKVGGEAPAESPEVSKFKANLMPSEKEGARAELLHKSADQLTNDEVTDLGHWFHDLQPSDPMRAVLDRKRRDFYSLTYGDDPAKTDATGRMIEPLAKRPIPEQPTPAKSTSGGTLIDGIQRIADGVANVVDTDGEGEAVKALQTGLNLAGQSLNVDGIAGPKTRAGLMQTLAEKGAGKTEELAALGRLKRFAENERARGGSASGLKNAVAMSVQPLFGIAQPKAAAEALQHGLNGLSADAAKVKKTPVPEPLRIDGDIGPITVDAFRSALMDHGPELMTKRFGEELGFGF